MKDVPGCVLDVKERPDIVNPLFGLTHRKCKSHEDANNNAELYDNINEDYAIDAKQWKQYR